MNSHFDFHTPPPKIRKNEALRADPPIAKSAMDRPPKKVNLSFVDAPPA